MTEQDPIHDPGYLPDNLPECHKLIKDLRAEVKRLIAIADTVSLLQQRVAELEKQVRRRNRKIFGKSSAKVPAESLTGTGKAVYDSYQPGLDAERAGLHIVPDDPQHGGGGRNIPESGVIERTVEHKLTNPAELACPGCGKPRHIFGFNTSHQLDAIKTAFELLKHVEYKYSCSDCDGHVITATKPYQPIDKGSPAPGMIAYVGVSKFDYHLPLYRQQRIYLAQSLPVSRSSMCRWLKQAATDLSLIVQRMRELILQSRLVQSDATSMPVIKKGLGKTHKGYTWIYRSEDYIIYDFTEYHNGEQPSRVLPGFKGVLLTDGAAVFNTVIAAGADRAGCFSHAFRYLEDARKEDAESADQGLAIMKRLFELEELAKPLPEEQRKALRQRRSRPLLADLRAWLDHQIPRTLPKSAMGDAITYLSNQWDALCYFADTGFVPMHNNASENGLRPAVLGRRNWLFAGSVDGGHTAAVWMSLVQTCHLHAIDPFEYIKDVLTRLPATPISQIDQFLPDRWKADRAQQTPT